MLDGTDLNTVIWSSNSNNGVAYQTIDVASPKVQLNLKNTDTSDSQISGSLYS